MSAVRGDVCLSDPACGLCFTRLRGEAAGWLPHPADPSRFLGPAPPEAAQPEEEPSS